MCGYILTLFFWLLFFLGGLSGGIFLFCLVWSGISSLFFILLFFLVGARLSIRSLYRAAATESNKVYTQLWVSLTDATTTRPRLLLEPSSQSRRRRRRRRRKQWKKFKDNYFYFIYLFIYLFFFETLHLTHSYCLLYFVSSSHHHQQQQQQQMS